MSPDAPPTDESATRPLDRLGALLGSWDPRRHPWWLRAAVAVLVTALATWMRVALAPAESGGRFVTLTLAAALCALYGGFRIGMLSTLLGMLAVNFLLVKPYFSFAIGNLNEAFWLNFWHLLTQVVVVGAIALMQKRTRELRASVEQAQRSHQQMLDTFENSGTGMAHTRLDGHWIRINRSYCDLLGYSRDEVVLRHWRQFTHPDDVEHDLHVLDDLVSGRIEHHTMEKRYLHKQGHTIWVLLSVSMIRHPDGSPDYMIVVAQDISSRKTTEDALRTSERLLSQAQELALMASWRYDAARRQFTTLGNANIILGVPRAVFSDLDMLAMTHPDDRLRMQQAWAAAFREGEPYDIEYRVNLAGQWHWVSVRAEFERGPDGRVTQGLGTVVDISAHKRAEQQIQQLNASLEERIRERTQALRAAYDELESYSYAVAHDLRSPLRIINGFAQALEEDNPALSVESRRHLERIREASKKMGELIDGLLKLSQLARGELQRAPVDLSAMATRQLRELAATSPERTVDWSVQPGMIAMAEEALIEALLQNLLHNAWKYSAHTAGARIQVSMQDSGGRREFVVADNGAGFDMARAAKLFQPFQRLHMPHEFAGLGIGLATARRIVLRHGGELRAQSAPGEGARFYFTLQPAA
ncbi:MAG: PAS domain S-box protein [Hydrogenophaga sp.]|uniref:PAS domain S-box protein n=1 Tax=Hydrogenophaga sp. TaxID=1904254 RepID=UPI0016B6E5B6|nr:PAS domain S-box protein [Hydrogenophaga sp.]NIM41471.1 PAS domain S-box protein [Hydrogenophaga sp.]NIN26787.1 PAS domain S-box protein [Hydrogenophaga sp.]NIN31486.1 PAS domain S-box protein [Hydrogenophaga sp.]NIN55717.1 PAS domain S-box protein [Hydrogenophaga sp.]NIO51880.1 PAS domain S-box protein [Hydrogenophaga sp.]